MAPKVATVFLTEEYIEKTHQLQTDAVNASVKDLSDIVEEGPLTAERHERIKKVQQVVMDKVAHYDRLLPPEHRFVDFEKKAVADQLTEEERLILLAAIKEVGDHVVDGLDYSSIEKLHEGVANIKMILDAARDGKAKAETTKEGRGAAES